MAQSPVELHRSSRGAGRVPPHSLEAEESLLGAMLLSRDAIAVAVETVKADDFYKPAHGHVFDAILALYGTGEPVDPVTVAEALRRAELLDAIGGKQTLFQIQGSTPASANAGHYARIVEEMALLRRLIAVAGEISEMGYELPEDVPATLDRAEAMVFEVAERRVSSTMVGLHDVLQQTLDQLEAMYGRDSITGIPTGFADLDEMLLGLQPSALVVVAARPSMGKTSFSLGLACHVAVEARRPVVFFSMEMGHLELTQRLLAMEARVDSKKLRKGNLADAEWHRIAHAVGRLGEAPLFIDDNPHCSVMEMRAKARRIKARYGDLGLVVVDYLQLMASPGRRSENRQVEVSELSRGLKILARELEAPVVALSQLNRSPEYRQDKRPMLADLRESGCLTADTRILRADTGEHVTLGSLLAGGERDIPVFTVDEDFRLVRGTMTHVFRSGVKPVYRLRLRSGFEVKASPNHPFLTFDGWRRLDELAPGERVAVPRRVPEPAQPAEWSDDQVVLLAHLLAGGTLALDQAVSYRTSDPAHVEVVEQAAAALGVQPRRIDRRLWTELRLSPPYHPVTWQPNPIVDWLSDLGLYGRHARDLTIPQQVFSLPRRQLATFLRHLWAVGGKAVLGRHLPALSYLSLSREMAAALQLLLFRFGVLSRVRTVEHPGGAVAYELRVAGMAAHRRFLDEIGTPGGPAPYRSSMGDTYYGDTVLQPEPVAVQTVVEEDDPHGLAHSDLFWDPVESIEYLGEMHVYDATVPGTHNFVANGVVVHNSIEQDADVVAFIYRDEVYNPESSDRGTSEIIVSKHRNGPTGVVRLAFLEHLTKFENMARDVNGV